VVELLVSRYQERKQTVPWREIYYIVFHQHKFSDKEKSVELSLDEGHTVAVSAPPLWLLIFVLRVYTHI